MRMRQAPEMPLLAAMQGYLAEQVAPFHTPGHKAGKGAPEVLLQHLGSSALALDLAGAVVRDQLAEDKKAKALVDGMLKDMTTEPAAAKKTTKKKA